jgi:hypothetical protein
VVLWFLFLSFGFAGRKLEMRRELAYRDLRPVGKKAGFGISGRI